MLDSEDSYIIRSAIIDHVALYTPHATKVFNTPPHFIHNIYLGAIDKSVERRFVFAALNRQGVRNL